jgi:transposase
LCCYEWISILGKHLSKWHLIRLLKAEKFTWRRVRKSLSSQRDRVMFDFFKQELACLRLEQTKGQITLWYYDESGFSLNPNAIYAWLPKNSPTQLPAQRGNVLTVAGFFRDDNTLQAYSHQGSTNSQLFIAYVDDFFKQYPPTKKTIVLIDNASFHKSADVKDKIKEWEKNNLHFQFLPPYCSELNPIETLWNHIKHLWLKIEDYTSAETLKNAVESIITQVGNKYTITFT